MKIENFLIYSCRSPWEETGTPMSPADADIMKELILKWSAVLRSEEPVPVVRFLDMPCDKKRRAIIFAPVGEPQIIVGFFVERNLYSDISNCCKLSHALSLQRAETLLATHSMELGTETVFPLEPTPLPTGYSELSGWQMIGETEKSLQLIARMLSASELDIWFDNFFLAVNPTCYAEEFTTVVCEDLPEGDWLKLKSEYASSNSPGDFRVRKRSLLARKTRKRTLRLTLIFSSVIVLLILICLIMLQMLNIQREKYKSLMKDYERIKYSYDRSVETINYLQSTRPVSDPGNNPGN